MWVQNLPRELYEPTPYGLIHQQANIRLTNFDDISHPMCRVSLNLANYIF